jgi:MFS family permease
MKAPMNTDTTRMNWLVLGVLIIAELTSAFEASMIYAALSGLHRIYGDPLLVGWLITGFLLVSAGAAAICGRLGDLFGRRTVLLWMLVFSALGSALSAWATSLEWIIVGRAIQGMSAAILPLCFGLVRENMPAAKVPLAVGVIAGTAMLGASFGYMAGGFIVDRFPWQTLFYVSTAMAVLSFATVWLWLKPTAGAASSAKSLDLVGGVLFVPAITGVVFAISKAKAWGWLDGRMLGLLVVSLILLLLWVRHELKHPNPLIDVRLLANRQIGLANLCFALAAFGSFQSQLILLPLLQQPTWTLVGLGITATLAGTLKGGMAAMGMFSASWGGSLAGRYGGRYVLLIGAVMLTLTWLVLTINHASLAFVLIANIFIVFGMTVLYAAVPNLVVEAAPADRSSEATGMSSVIRAIGGALGAQAIAYALASSTISDPSHGPGRYPTDDAYTAAFALVAAASFLCTIAAWFLPRRVPSAKASVSAKLAPH